jgi:hypothetical protein
MLRLTNILVLDISPGLSFRLCLLQGLIGHMLYEHLLYHELVNVLDQHASLCPPRRGGMGRGCLPLRL